MRTRYRSPIPKPIVRLQKQLTQWRSTNRPRTRLPEPFWNTAVELARQYGIYQTARRLGLDYVGLKKRLHGSQSTQQKRTAEPTQAAFVELVVPHKPDEWLIELESSRGDKMRMQGKAAMPLDWTALVRAWREVES